MRKLGFLSLLVSQGLKSQTVHLLCRHNDNMPRLRRGVGKSQRVYQQRSLSQQQQDFCGKVREKVIIVEMLLVVLSVTQLNKGTHPPQFAGQAGTPSPGVYSTCCCCHIYLVTCLLDVVEQAAVKEGLNGANGPNIVLVFPSLDEGNESGGVQV